VLRVLLVAVIAIINVLTALSGSPLLGMGKESPEIVFGLKTEQPFSGVIFLEFRRLAVLLVDCADSLFELLKQEITC